MSGLLGSVFSLGDEAKRRMRGLLFNPNEVAGQLAHQIQDADPYTFGTGKMTGVAPSARMMASASDPEHINKMAGGLLGITAFHGSPFRFDKFDFGKSVDGGVHFGTKEQAAMRAMKKGQVVEADLDLNRMMRSRDTGGAWAAKIKNAKSKGYDGIVYLNRYEGVSLDTIKRAQEAGINLDRLTDAQFRKFVPEATESYIAFRPDQIKIKGLIGGDK